MIICRCIQGFRYMFLIVFETVNLILKQLLKLYLTNKVQIGLKKPFELRL